MYTADVGLVAAVTPPPPPPPPVTTARAASTMGAASRLTRMTATTNCQQLSVGSRIWMHSVYNMHTVTTTIRSFTTHCSHCSRVVVPYVVPGTYRKVALFSPVRSNEKQSTRSVRKRTAPAIQHNMYTPLTPASFPCHPRLCLHSHSHRALQKKSISKNIW